MDDRIITAVQPVYHHPIYKRLFDSWTDGSVQYRRVASRSQIRDGEKLDPDKNKDDAYYPPTYVDTDPDKAVAEAQKKTPSGTPQYTNQIQLEGEYSFTQNIILSSRFTYTIILNDDNIKNKFEQGAEFAISCTFKLL